jgi:hypothetical protein
MRMVAQPIPLRLRSATCVFGTPALPWSYLLINVLMADDVCAVRGRLC